MQYLIYILLITSANGLVVSTYNMWNTMFNWPIRKLRILEMIRNTDSDVVALQEVRSGRNAETDNQIVELKADLPSQFKWHIFKVANNVSFVNQPINTDYTMEGIGIISRLRIIDSSVHYLLPHAREPDKNKRVILQAQVKDMDGTLYDILVVHLSYHRQQQCRNVADIISFLTRRRLHNVILLGDFNTYVDFNWPLQIFTDGTVTKDNPCWRVRQKVSLSGRIFKDAWLTRFPDEKGLTFSNMPTPGMQSRPDRILVASRLKVQSIRLIGNGTRYKQRYKAAVHWSRFATIIQSAYLSYQGASGFPCQHDCGPQGSCQCGVCIAVGNHHDCRLPNCDTCNTDVFKTLVLHFFLYVTILFHLFYSIVVILTVGANSYGDTIYSILGFKCCLFNPEMCKSSTRAVRRKQILLKLCQWWPLFRLPPYVQFLVSVIAIWSMSVYTKTVFKPVINSTYNVLEEELFPSDHLMVVAHVLSMQ